MPVAMLAGISQIIAESPTSPLGTPPGPPEHVLDSARMPVSRRSVGRIGTSDGPDARSNASMDPARPDPRHLPWMVAGAAEVAVVGRALLGAVSLADRAVHVQDEPGVFPMRVGGV